MPRNPSKKFARVAQIGVLAAIGLVTLGACSTLEAQPQADLSAGSLSYDYVLSQKITVTETQASLERRLGGRIVVFQPQAGFAVLGFRKGDAGLQNPEIASRLESNKAAFFSVRPNARITGSVTAWSGGSVTAWSGGSVTAWSGGSVTAWSGGSVTAWSGGTYAPVPQNTGNWQQIHLQQGQNLATHLGNGVKIAVIDTGIDIAHPAFNGSLLQSDMWDFVDNDATPQEVGTDGQPAYGHGTNVAGIVLQVAPNAKILPLRVLGSDGSGDISKVVAAINYAVSKNVQVINLSLGSDGLSQSVEDALALAASHGIYIVSSAGNANSNSVTYPASEAYNDATLSGAFSLSVGSVDSSDAKSGFSNFGTSAKPLEIVAPGEMVYAPVPGNRMGAWSGTSMAAPMVSGAIALALGESLNVSGAALSTKTKTKVDGVYANGANAAYLNLLGQGRLNIEQLLTDTLHP